MAALALGHVDTLVASLSSDDELVRFAAATRLIESDTVAPLGDTIRTAPPDHQVRLLRQIADRAKPALAIREAVYEVARATSERDVRRAAIRQLCHGCPQGEVERLADAAQGEPSSYQAILQTAGLGPESLERLGVYFLDHHVFRADQYGMRDIAKQGRMPAGFVPKHWGARDDKDRIELCRFAGMQLEEYADENLHRFLVGLAFGQDSVPVRATVWSSIYYWYRRLDDRGDGPLRIETESLNRFFGSVGEFVSVFTRFLQDRLLAELLSQSSIYERVSRLIRYSDDGVLQKLAIQPKAALEFADALKAVAHDPRSIFASASSASATWAGLARSRNSARRCAQPSRASKARISIMPASRRWNDSITEVRRIDKQMWGRLQPARTSVPPEDDMHASGRAEAPPQAEACPTFARHSILRTSLIVAQRRHRIDARRPARRHEAGEQTRPKQQRRHRHKRIRVERGNVAHQPRQHSHRRQAACQPQ